MSVKSNIVNRINTINTSANVTEADISFSMISTGWENVCEAVQGQNALITEKLTNSTWSVLELRGYGLTHFKPVFRASILNGKVAMPYKSDITGSLRRIVITQNKVYKFPTSNVNYFDSAVQNVSNYGAAAYFDSVQQTLNRNTATNAGNSAVSNYNYAN